MSDPTPNPPQVLDDALALMVRAVAGMSQVEKNMTMRWMQSTMNDEKAPPPAKQFARAAYNVIGAVALLSTSPDEPGYTAQAARAEELMRQLRGEQPESRNGD